MNNQWRTRIINSVAQYKPGTMVELKQILAQYWTSIPSPTQFGKDFYQEVLAGMYSNIRFHHKNSANHAYYEIL